MAGICPSGAMPKTWRPIALSNSGSKPSTGQCHLLPICPECWNKSPGPLDCSGMAVATTTTTRGAASARNSERQQQRSSSSRRRTPLQRTVENHIWMTHQDSIFFICNILHIVPRDVDNNKAVIISVWTRPRPKIFQDRALSAVATPIVQRRQTAVAAAGKNENLHRGGSGMVQSPEALEHVKFVGKICILAPDVLNQYCQQNGRGPPQWVELQLVDDMGNGVTS